MRFCGEKHWPQKSWCDPKQGLPNTVRKLFNTPLIIAIIFLWSKLLIYIRYLVSFSQQPCRAGVIFLLLESLRHSCYTILFLHLWSAVCTGLLALLCTHKTPCNHRPFARAVLHLACSSLPPPPPPLFWLYLLQVSPQKSFPQSGFCSAPSVNQVRFSCSDSTLNMPLSINYVVFFY